MKKILLVQSFLYSPFPACRSLIRVKSLQVKNRYVAFVVCLFQLPVLHSQTDSVRHLTEVEVDAPRSDLFKPGSKVIRLDSSFLAQFSGSTLSEALSYDGTIALKQYGAGALSSTSFRGASSAQTPVIWNGFNIQSPMYGQVDLSLFPVAAADKISVQYGAGAAQWGSGAVSGALVLDNKVNFNTGINAGISSSVASFGTYNNLVNVGFGGKKLAVSAKAYYNTAENNFPYNNIALKDAPRMTQANNEIRNYGAMLQLSGRMKERNFIDVNAWYQNTYRQIPTMMTQQKSVAFQEDRSLKLSAEWKHVFERSVVKIRTGLFDDQLGYNDSLSSLYSLSHALVSISEIEYTYTRRLVLLQGGVNTTYSTAASDGYLHDFSQWRNSLFLLLKLHTANRRLQVQFSLRKEFIDDKAVYPAITVGGKQYDYKFLPTASLGADVSVFKWLQAKANVSTVYRVPTLNDLYWTPGGNPDLLPEEGVSEELTLAALFRPGNVKISYDVTGFNRNVNNWIIWLPGDYYWSPVNVMNVWSRGFEHVFGIAYTKNKFSLKADLNYTFTLSTSERAKTQGDASLHKQLIYAPVHQGAFKLMISYSRWFVSYMHSYTGYRYTSTDNLEYLPGYDVARVSAGKSFNIKKMNFSISAYCSNLLDEQYQSLLWRAMPGRSYGLSVKVNFENNRK